MEYIDGKRYAGERREITFAEDQSFGGWLKNSEGFFEVEKGQWRVLPTKDGNEILVSWSDKNGTEIERKLNLGRFLEDRWHPPYRTVKYRKNAENTD
ncbi:hypothetical protein GCM10007100_23900 [Roseibacillus persicicus]|uniref:Uncharacterized protein n=1 Tax=Roseibacillus persicicus TaxID=454148 RepID=A0A918WM79_9BACT|nr:hypothetical protein GCM10007100_23900 [Roseibacillus persicicus]